MHAVYAISWSLFLLLNQLFLSALESRNGCSLSAPARSCCGSGEVAITEAHMPSKLCNIRKLETDWPTSSLAYQNALSQRCDPLTIVRGAPRCAQTMHLFTSFIPFEMQTHIRRIWIRLELVVRNCSLLTWLDYLSEENAQRVVVN